MPEAWFNNSLRPRKPEGSLGRTAQDGHLDSHTAPELCSSQLCFKSLYTSYYRCKNAKFYRIKMYCAAIMFAAVNLHSAATDIIILLHQISNCGQTTDDTVIAVRRLT